MLGRVSNQPGFGANIIVTQQAGNTFRQLGKSAELALISLESAARGDGRKGVDVFVSTNSMRQGDKMPIMINVSETNKAGGNTIGISHCCDANNPTWRKILSSQDKIKNLYEMLAGQFDAPAKDLRIEA